MNTGANSHASQSGESLQVGLEFTRIPEALGPEVGSAAGTTSVAVNTSVLQPQHLQIITSHAGREIHIDDGGDGGAEAGAVGGASWVVEALPSQYAEPCLSTVGDTAGSLSGIEPTATLPPGVLPLVQLLPAMSSNPATMNSVAGIPAMETPNSAIWGIGPPGFTTMPTRTQPTPGNVVEAPLRFKMPPSPVPLRELLANADPMPSPERLNRYRQIMLRWYQRIEAVGENGRMQTRSRCPEPPANIVDLRVSCDIEALLNWSSVCCRWWDETSRKRSRRGHRSGRGAWAGGRDGTLARGQVSAQTQAHSERQDQTQAQSQSRSGLASADTWCPNWVHDLLNDE